MRRHAHRTALAGLLLAAATAALSTGCAKALFPKDEPRTQFDAHDRTLGFTPLEEPDVFGNPQPALRQRLTQHQ